MYAYSKRFRVVTFATSTRGEGWWEVVLVAPDGECWEIIIDPEGPFLVPGDEVEMPLVMVTGSDGDREMVPCWAVLNAAEQSKLDLHNPFIVVADVWGREVAAKHFSPTEPAPDQ